MIEVSRLNGSRFYINAELIQAVEETPDTHILLVNGQRYVVAERAAQVVDAVLGYRRDLLEQRPVHRAVSGEGGTIRPFPRITP